MSLGKGKQALSRTMFMWIRLCAFAIAIVLSLEIDANEKDKQEEEFFPTFVYTGPLVTSHAGGRTHTDLEVHEPKLSAKEMGRRQESVRQFLESRKGASLSPQDVAEIYRRADHFSIIHGMVGSGEINAEKSKQIGAGRAALVEQTLGELTKHLKSRGIQLGVNDFGSGEVNAKTDIDMTLFPDTESVKSGWLTSEFRKIFTGIAGIDPGRADVVVHKYDATIPDWRQERAVADFELRMRVGRQGLKRNPEAYFLEGAYVQEVMGRSVKDGAKTFRWFDVEDGKVNSKRMNAAEVPQFFYHPDVKPRYAFGAAVGNWHFYNAHAGDAVPQAKYLLRSVDEGASLARSADKSFQQLKTTNYTELPDSARRAVVQQLYAHLPDKQKEILMALEVASDIRSRKTKGLPFGDDVVLKPFMDYERSIVGEFAGLNDHVLLENARKNYRQVSQFILMENIMVSAPARFTDWLSPQPDDVAKNVVHFVDEGGDLKELKYTPETQKRLQYAAFFELMDSVEIMRPDMIKRMKRENPRFTRDIAILEGIIRKRREMMLLPSDLDLPPKDALDMRQRSAQSVYEAYVALSHSVNSGKIFDKVKAGYAFGQAFENWARSRMGDALVHISGKRFGTLLDSMRLTTLAVDDSLSRGKKRIKRPTEFDAGDEVTSASWLARMSYASSVTTVLTEYEKQGEVNQQVIKTAVLEGLNYVPIANVIVEVSRGGGTAVAQIFLVQFVPGYGQVMLVINFSKGLVNLGGMVIFEPLKRDKIKLAYQGYLDPEAAGLITGGVKRRIESPRPHLLYPVDPERKLSLEERREKFYSYLEGKRIAKLLSRRLGFDHPEDKLEAQEWRNAEAEILPQVVQHYVHQWWNAQGPFQTFDELTVKRAMDEHYGEEIRAELVRILVKDYWTGKIRTEEIQHERLAKSLAKVASMENQVLSALDRERQNLLSHSEANPFSEAGRVMQGVTLERMPQVKAGITITASPRVKIERAPNGQDGERIESYGLRAVVNASPNDAHPAPFRVAWELKPLDHSTKKLSHPGNQVQLETASDKILVTAILQDGNSKEIERASVELPVHKNHREEHTLDAKQDVHTVAANGEVVSTAQEEQGDGKGTGCGALFENCGGQCETIRGACVKENCDRHKYSGCALDCGGCSGRACAFAYKAYWCDLHANYLQCVRSFMETYLASVQTCLQGFSGSTSENRRQQQEFCLKSIEERYQIEILGRCREQTCSAKCAETGQTGQVIYPDKCKCQGEVGTSVSVVTAEEQTTSVQGKIITEEETPVTEKEREAWETGIFEPIEQVPISEEEQAAWKESFLTIRTPNVVGLMRHDAENQIQEVGLVPSPTDGARAHSQDYVDRVEKQEPSASTLQDSGGPVTIWLYKGPSCDSLATSFKEAMQTEDIDNASLLLKKGFECSFFTAAKKELAHTINCRDLRNRFSLALESNNLTEARKHLIQSDICPFYMQFVKLFNETIDREEKRLLAQRCDTLHKKFESAVELDELDSARSTMGQARECPIYSEMTGILEKRVEMIQCLESKNRINSALAQKNFDQAYSILKGMTRCGPLYGSNRDLINIKHEEHKRQVAECSDLKGLFNNSAGREDFDEARVWLQQARDVGCEFFWDGASWFNHKLEERNRQVVYCRKQKRRISDELEHGNPDQALHLLGLAEERGCSFEPGIRNQIGQIVNQHRAYDRYCQQQYLLIMAATAAEDVRRAADLLYEAKKEGCIYGPEVEMAIRALKPEGRDGHGPCEDSLTGKSLLCETPDFDPFKMPRSW